MTAIKGRGAGQNTPNRFERLQLELDPQENIDPDDPPPKLQTEFYVDHSKTILSSNDSPDISFTYSINPYRGCEHGCIYCYARPTHEYLGFSAGLDFESRIFVKQNAAQLLRDKLMSPRWRPEPISISGVTDCYQPVERKLKITRSCIDVLREFRNPFSIITKNHLVTRDIDILSEMAIFEATAVFVSVTTLDAELCAVMEPRTSRPQARLRTIKELSAAGIPVGVMVAPVVPGLTDHEMPQILEAAREAGATTAGFVPLRLPYAVAPLFEQWIGTHFPLRKDKVLGRIRELRGGKLNDPNFGSRMQGFGPFAEQISALFDVYSKKFGFNERRVKLSTLHFRRPTAQLDLFSSLSV